MRGSTLAISLPDGKVELVEDPNGEQSALSALTVAKDSTTQPAEDADVLITPEMDQEKLSNRLSDEEDVSSKKVNTRADLCEGVETPDAVVAVGSGNLIIFKGKNHS